MPPNNENMPFEASPSSERRQVLIIGPSQNGKSTFINRLIALSCLTQDIHAAEGNGTLKKTCNSSFYDVDIPLTDYFLQDMETGQRHPVPPIYDEESIFNSLWYRKQKTSNLRILPEFDPRDCAIVKLRLIDTPGLDDSEGKDFENMSDVLAFLNELSQSPNEWERKLAAIVIVYNAHNSFSSSFQSLIKDYQRCMPNLFGNLIVVNTHFSVTAMAEKRRHLISQKLLGRHVSARDKIIQDRQFEFAKILGNDTVPIHFFIDSKPKGTLAYDALLSYNTVTEIATNWFGCSSMPIKQMRLIKNPTMQSIDAKLQVELNNAIMRWNGQKARLLTAAGFEVKARSLVEERLLDKNNEIERIKEDLELWDNDGEVFINTYTTSVKRNAVGLAARWVVRKTITEVQEITEAKYKEFTVQTQNVQGGNWIKEEWDKTGQVWTGTFKLDPGQTIGQIARSYTTNRILHSDEIKKARKRLNDCMLELARCDQDWAEFEDGSKGRNPDVEILVSFITEAKDLVETLSLPDPPLDRGFIEASLERYSTPQNEITIKHLYSLVDAIKPKLSHHIRAILSENYSEDFVRSEGSTAE